MTTASPSRATEVTVTVGGEARTVSFETYGEAVYGATIRGVVAVIGRGQARYPAYLQLHRMAEGQRTPPGATRVTDSGGREWSYHLNTVVRNRQARIVAWADVAPATNSADQTRR